MQRCNDLLIAGIKTYGGLTSYLGNPDGGRSLLSELQKKRCDKEYLQFVRLFTDLIAREQKRQ